MNQKCKKKKNNRTRRAVFPSETVLALSYVFMVSNNALHSGYSVCHTCARLQGHVYVQRRIQASFYRASLQVQMQGAMQRGVLRDGRRNSPLLIATNVRDLFRETAFNFESGA